MAGECDIMPYPNPADIEALKANPNLTVIEQAGLNIGYLAYNTTQRAVRQARSAQGAQHGDQQAGDHRRACSRAPATPAENLIPPTMWSYNNDVKDDAYDPEAAKKMLGRGRRRT